MILAMCGSMVASSHPATLLSFLRHSLIALFSSSVGFSGVTGTGMVASPFTNPSLSLPINPKVTYLTPNVINFAIEKYWGKFIRCLSWHFWSGLILVLNFGFLSFWCTLGVLLMHALCWSRYFNVLDLCCYFWYLLGFFLVFFIPEASCSFWVEGQLYGWSPQ
jgi:hypothetical protein